MANSRPQSLDSSSTLLQSTIFGLKVFMDAHQPVTLKEGDRYPLGPPSFEATSPGHFLFGALGPATVASSSFVSVSKRSHASVGKFELPC